MTEAALDVDEAVFDAVECIPPGRVSTYGAIGKLVGIGPRRVARALATGGGAVPWFRVVRWWYRPLRVLFHARGWSVVARQPADSATRREGRDWPADGETMIGLRRLDNV